MKAIEYQLVKEILDKTWTKSINTDVQKWTLKNCVLIAKDIETVTGILLNEKSILRFSQLLESTDISRNRTKNILAMYINGQRSNSGNSDTAAWDDLLSAKSRIDNNTPIIDGFWGKYQIHYKSKLSKDIQSDATLEIDKNGNCIFTQASNYKNRHWSGKATKKKGHLFITLENEVEILYLILKTTFGNDYWVGMFLSINDDTETPNSPIILATKYGLETKDKQKRIEFFFKQRGDNYRLSIDEKLLITVNDAYNIDRVIQHLNEGIASIIGNWIVYSSDGDELYYQSRMAINGSHDVVYEGLRRDYTGNMIIKNQDVYIYLNGEKNALLCFNLNYLKVDKINHILATFATLGSNGGFPTYGSAVLVRSELNFERLEKKEITKNTADYEILKKVGILDNLTFKRFKNRKNMVAKDNAIT